MGETKDLPQDWPVGDEGADDADGEARAGANAATSRTQSERPLAGASSSGILVSEQEPHHCAHSQERREHLQLDMPDPPGIEPCQEVTVPWETRLKSSA